MDSSLADHQFRNRSDRCHGCYNGLLLTYTDRYAQWLEKDAHGFAVDLSIITTVEPDTHPDLLHC